MSSLFLKRSDVLWKVIGIAIVTFLALLSSFFNIGLLEGRHGEVMLGSFLIVVALCGLLFSDSLKIIRLQSDEISRLMGVKLALASLIDLKDSYTEGHSKNVRDLTRRFAEYLKLPSEEIEEITLAAELHDIGKIGIPDSILKKPGKLNGEEYLAIKNHPWLGAEALKSLKGFKNVVNIIRHHHERYDGTGYPDRLSAHAIPRGSRILSIIDSFDAMVHSRAYRDARPRKEVLDTLVKEGGHQFDPALAQVFIKFAQQKTSEQEYDPVCGMNVHPKNSLFKFTFNNQTYKFCSEVCLIEFSHFPEKYINKSQKTAAST